MFTFACSLCFSKLQIVMLSLDWFCSFQILLMTEDLNMNNKHVRYHIYILSFQNLPSSFVIASFQVHKSSFVTALECLLFCKSIQLKYKLPNTSELKRKLSLSPKVVTFPILEVWGANEYFIASMEILVCLTSCDQRISRWFTLNFGLFGWNVIH